jgi:hypothetical protein
MDVSVAVTELDAIPAGTAGHFAETGHHVPADVLSAE